MSGRLPTRAGQQRGLASDPLRGQRARRSPFSNATRVLHEGPASPGPIARKSRLYLRFHDIADCTDQLEPTRGCPDGGIEPSRLSSITSCCMVHPFSSSGVGVIIITSGGASVQRGLVEIAFQRRGLSAPWSAFSRRLGIIVINFRYQRFQMPLYECAISIFDAAAVTATLQNLEP
jgi:hypothetical protein